MPEAAEIIRSWASDWSDQFDQSFSEEKLKDLVGKKVKAERPATEEDGPKGFVGTICGYSVDTIVYQPDDDFIDPMTVNRYSLITAEGQQVAIFSGMTIEEVSEE